MDQKQENDGNNNQQGAIAVNGCQSATKPNQHIQLPLVSRDAVRVQSQLAWRPSWRFSVLCTHSIMTVCRYFDNLKFDIFDAVVLSATLSRLVDIYVSTITSDLVQNWFRVFSFSSLLFHWYKTCLWHHSGWLVTKQSSSLQFGVKRSSVDLKLNIYSLLRIKQCATLLISDSMYSPHSDSETFLAK